MRALLPMLAAMALAACASVPDLPPERLAPQIRCADQCRNPCDTSVPKWLPPDARSPLAWDLIRPQVVVPLRSKLVACDAQRASCVACIDAAIKAGAVRP